MRRRAALAIVLLAAGFVAALAIAFGPYQISSGEPFTKLEVTWPKEASSHQSLMEGKELFANARIINHEKRPMNYTLKLLFRNSALFSRDLFLGRDETWQGQISFMLTGPATSTGPKALDLLLYQGSNLSSPYKEERLWVNLSRNNSGESSSQSQVANSKGINSEKNNSPVILEDKSKVTVLSAGGGGMGGSMGGSMGGGSSTGSTKTAAKLPASEKALQPIKSISAETASPQVGPSNESSLSNSNSPPRLAALQANNSHPLRGSRVLWTANASDAQGDSISYKFLVNDKEMTDWSLSNSWIWNTTSLAPGDYEIRVLAKDEKNASADPLSSSLHVAVTLLFSNQPPALKALVPDKTSPQLPGAAIFWKAEAADEEGDKILYKYLLDGREVRKWSRTNSWSWLSQGLPAREYQISVLAIDGKHASEDSFDSIMNASFTLSRANQAPVLQELKMNRSSPQSRGGMITWTASAFDPDNDTIYYKFMENDADVTDWSPSNSWVWNTSSEKPGDYRIAVLAKDGLHASKESFDSSLEGTFALTSPNNSPEVKELKADRSSPQAKGGVITWTATAVDPDGDEISYKFLANDIEVEGWSSSDSWVWDTSSATPGEYRIKVLARDGKHASKDSFDSSKDAAITILASNQPPALKALVPDKTSPQVQGATVIWKAEAQDAEGDSILYKFQLNGRDMSRWSELSSWKWSSKDLAAGDYKIRVLARDGKHASEDSFDSSMDAVFSLISEIDQQIDQLMKKRSSDPSQQENYQSSDIQVTSANGTVLGKSSSTAGQEKTVTPRKLGG